MADYYSILKKTIESLPENTGAARRSVYSRARNAIVNQLKSYEPPLSPSEITAEQLRLEEAIRKVEAEAARATLGLGARTASKAEGEKPDAKTETSPPSIETPKPDPVPAASPLEREEPKNDKPSYGDDVDLPVAAREPGFGPKSAEPTMGSWEGEQTTQATAKAETSRIEPPLSGEAPAVSSYQTSSSDPTLDDDADDLQEQPAEQGKAGKSSKKEAKTKSKRRGRGTADKGRMSDQLRSGGSSKGGLGSIGLIVLLVLILAGVGAVVYSQRDNITAMMGGDGQEVVATPDEDEAVESVAGPVTSEPEVAAEEPVAEETADSGKIEDRLLDDSGQPAIAPDARTVTTQPIRPGETVSVAPSTPSDPAINEALETAAEEQSEQGNPDGLTTTTTDVAPVDENAAASVLPDDGAGGVERSILYEEGDENNGAGTASQGQVTWALETDTDLEGRSQQVLTAEVLVPDRNVSVSMRIKQNDDTSLPASHLVELKYEFPDDFAAGDVVNVPGLVMKPTEEARGDALIGASVKVSPGYFWIALSSIDSERDRNLALLRERAWIDIPMLYENGRRGILTLEKGTAGSAAVNQAIAAWVGQ